MTRRLLVAAIVMTGVALISLLGYSLERSAWLFSLFEENDAFASAAALIVGAGALHQIEARAWANRALGVVLSVQALANLSAGYLRGDWATLQGFGSDDAARAVMSVLWLVTNLAVPLLVLFLSKLLERLIAALAEQGGIVIVEDGVGESGDGALTVPSGAPGYTTVSDESIEVVEDEVPVEQEYAATPPALSKTAKVKLLAKERGVSESTIWREVGAGKTSLNGVHHEH